MSPATATRNRVADATLALARRRQRSRRRLALRVGIGVLIAAVVGLAGLLVWSSPILAVDRVVVTGTSLLRAGAVAQQAAVPLGRPLARVDLGQVEQRVATMAPVRTVQAERTWPHTVTIRISERVAAFEVPQNGRVMLVDSEGVGYAAVPSPPAGLLSADVDLADPVVLRSVATVAQALPEPVRVEVGQIEAASPENIRLRLRGGQDVVWGSANQSAVKGQVLAGLLVTKAKHYDVSGPANPTTR